MDMEVRVERLEEYMSELKTDVKAIRSDLQYVKGRLDALPPDLGGDLRYLKGRLDSIPTTLHADLQYVRGRLDAMPTTIQLLGFIIAVFVAAGLTRFFGH